MSIFEQFVHRWPYGCTAQEWQETLHVGIPVVVWYAFSQYLMHGGYVSEEAQVFAITEESQHLRTQLKEIAGTS